jgi:hypothetical protein
MKSLMISFLTLIICSVTIHSANADRCSDYRQRTGLDLNEAECYVLEQVEKGKVTQPGSAGLVHH